MDEATLWSLSNRRLLAKIIAEGSYEGCFRPVRVASEYFRLGLGDHHYRFRARVTPWDYLWPDPDSLTRNGDPAVSACQLAVDAQRELAMSDIVLGNFLEELLNTLAGDCLQLQRLSTHDADSMLDLPGPVLEGLLDGHPKALANRGRLGWGHQDMLDFSPEGGRTLRLRWLAVSRGSAHVAGSPVPGHCLTPRELAGFRHRCNPSQWQLLPVHPWQWQQRIRTQYAGALAASELVDLGPAGPRFRPQQSIRTLSNDDHPDRCDLKLALSILNTSCYRGIPAGPLALAPALSHWLEGLTREDPVLAQAGMAVQRELGSVHLPHPHQSQVAGSPYRYQEMLGAVWRQSLASKTASGERGLLLATLMQRDIGGRPLIGALIERSGLTVADWLERLFQRVTVPLYHLLCRYGIGLVAHGQNLGLVLHDWAPERVVIKDFHGDLRAATAPLPEQSGIPDDLLAGLTRLPPAHLLHDLFTGHLATTLRFVSPLLEDSAGYPESRFYRLLADCLERYQRQHPQLAPRFREFDLLRPRIERVCINRVRFRIGYSDAAQRPQPEIGAPLSNPLHQEPVHD